MSQNMVEVTVEDAQKQVTRGETLQRLLQNPDFIEIIGKAYYVEEPARLTGLLGDIGGSYRWCPNNQLMSMPPAQFTKMQADIERDLHAVGALQSFFRVVMWRAEMAQQALDDLEAQKNAPVDPDAADVTDLDTDFPEA